MLTGVCSLPSVIFITFASRSILHLKPSWKNNPKFKQRGRCTESCFPLYDSHLRRLLVSRPHLRHTDERIGILVCLAHGHGSCHLQRQRRVCGSESTSLFLSSAAGFRHGVYDRNHFVIPAMMLMLLALLALRPRLAKVADKGSDVTLDHRNTKPHPVIFALTLGLYRVFFHLRIKNFAEIICHTINFSNFVLGDHSDFCLYFFVFQHYKVTTNFANHQIYKHL